MTPAAFLVALGITLAVPAWIIGWSLDEVFEVETDWQFRVCSSFLAVGIVFFVVGGIWNVWLFVGGLC